MAALEFPPSEANSVFDRLDAISSRASDLEIKCQTSGALSPAMFDQIERMRGEARTIEQQSALYRLESIAVRMRDLETQSENILSKVVAAPNSDDSFEIPEFLRREG